MSSPKSPKINRVLIASRAAIISYECGCEERVLLLPDGSLHRQQTRWSTHGEHQDGHNSKAAERKVRRALAK